VPRRGLLAALCGFLVALLAPPALAIDAPALQKSLLKESRRMGPYAGAIVRDMDTGQTLFSSRPDLALVPASNEKLLVTSAALLRMGPTATMKTLLVAPSAPADGVIDGNVALVGGGDPYLRSTGLVSLAREVAGLGVTQITGHVLADASLLDSRVGSFDSAWSFDPDLGGRLAALVVDGGRGADPVLHAATTLHKALRRAHVKLAGLPRRGRLPRPNTELGRLTSPPLSTVIADINGPSDNFAAELLLKDLGAFVGGPGTTFAGAGVVNTTLARLGVHATIYDGSGLSRADHVTPRTIGRLLDAMATRPEGAALDASLPLAGRTGTLAHRMRSSAARGRCRAKTGTLIGVSALSGYCTTYYGARVAFSFIENRVCAVCAKRVEDRMTAALARYGG
jgi:D-alanyl-D-alanine carboxypeptidase/D-alanyl-D-alanine-endopeptidase (penicillin-binding protein 4)